MRQIWLLVSKREPDNINILRWALFYPYGKRAGFCGTKIFLDQCMDRTLEPRFLRYHTITADEGTYGPALPLFQIRNVYFEPYPKYTDDNEPLRKLTTRGAEQLEPERLGSDPINLFETMAASKFLLHRVAQVSFLLRVGMR